MAPAERLRREITIRWRRDRVIFALQNQFVNIGGAVGGA